MTQTSQESWCKIWPAGFYRTARKEHLCDYWFGVPRGHCPETIKVGERYFDPGESNPARAGGFGGYRYCLHGDHPPQSRDLS